MKILACLLGLAGLVGAFGQEQQLKEANFEISFEPTVVLQAGAPIPFWIMVKDPRHKPVQGARVTLQIEMPGHLNTKVYKATEIQPGSYIAKPMFAVKGTWEVYVEVRRNEEMSARTIEYYVKQ